MYVAGDERFLDEFVCDNKVEKFIKQNFFFIFSNIIR